MKTDANELSFARVPEWWPVTRTEVPPSPEAPRGLVSLFAWSPDGGAHLVDEYPDPDYEDVTLFEVWNRETGSIRRWVSSDGRALEWIT